MPRRREYKTNAARQAAYRQRRKQGSHSARVEYETPPEIFEWLDKEFGFTLDVCASAENAKCARFLTKQDDALKQEWTGVCWMNPPSYGRIDEVGYWVKRAYESSLAGATVVCLVPAQTDRDWFHDWVLNKAEIRFLRYRLWFEGRGVGSHVHFPWAVVIYRPATAN